MHEMYELASKITATRYEKMKFARKLRGRQTRAEWELWKVIRARQCAGVKFRRQMPIGPFIVDFCSIEAMLVIEIDGGIHRWRQKYDRKREYYLQNRGFAVIRFSNEKVLKDLPGTLLKIAQVVGNIYAIRETTTEKKYLPSPREEKGRG